MANTIDLTLTREQAEDFALSNVAPSWLRMNNPQDFGVPSMSGNLPRFHRTRRVVYASRRLRWRLRRLPDHLRGRHERYWWVPFACLDQQRRLTHLAGTTILRILSLVSLFGSPMQQF